jgi:hypothetical protein
VNSGWVRNAVDLVLERRKLSQRDVVDAVFGPDDGRAPTAGAAWTPGGGEPVWTCVNRLCLPDDGDFCTYCGRELED